MKLEQAIKQAVATNDCVMLGQIVDQLRFKAHLDYEGCFEMVHKHSGIDRTAFEDFMWMADEEEAKS